MAPLPLSNCKSAPKTSGQAYAGAEEMLKNGHFTFSDDEIDALLPTQLRKNLDARYGGARKIEFA